MKILVTGATGQLGQSFRRLADARGDMEFVFTSTKDLDLLDMPRVSDFIRYESFDWILNFAAYTAVDKAEEEKDLAFALNRDAVFNMVQAAEWIGAKFVHISTDYVFDGKKARPYVEDDPVNPLSVYAKSKAQGEEYVVNYHSGLVIRTSWLYSEYGHNFVKTMLGLAAKKDMIQVVYDQTGTPTYAGDLARMILVLIEKVNAGEIKFQSGVYHYSNEGVASWYDFAKAVFEIKNINVRLQPVLTGQFPRPAPRPFYSVMDKTKIKKYLGLTIPYWRDSLRIMLRDLSSV